MTPAKVRTFNVRGLSVEKGQFVVSSTRLQRVLRIPQFRSRAAKTPTSIVTIDLQTGTIASVGLDQLWKSYRYQDDLNRPVLLWSVERPSYAHEDAWVEVALERLPPGVGKIRNITKETH